MTDNEMRIAIAEACGWTNIIFRGVFEPKERDFAGTHASCTPPGATGKWQGTLPDYINDLNAMHEAEEILWKRNDWSACNYEEKLEKMTSSWAWYATARQRAEAFLRTIGKHKEPQ